MRSNPLALTGLVATILASSLGCDLGDVLGQVKSMRLTDFTVPIPESGECVISCQNGQVQCKAGDVSEIQVKAVITARAGTTERAEELVERITIDRTEIDGVARITANIPTGVNGSVSMAVTVPSDTKLNIRTSNGRIEVTGVSNRTIAHTSNGAIRLDDCAGDIDATSSNGKITIQGDLLNNVQARTSNGAIRIKGSLAEGDHHVRTSNGAIRVNVTGPPITVTAKTSNAKIRANGRKIKNGQTVTLGVESSSEESSDEGVARLSLKTSNGSIEVEHSESEEVVDDDEEDDQGE